MWNCDVLSLLIRTEMLRNSLYLRFNTYSFALLTSFQHKSNLKNPGAVGAQHPATPLLQQHKHGLAKVVEEQKCAITMAQSSRIRQSAPEAAFCGPFGRAIGGGVDRARFLPFARSISRSSPRSLSLLLPVPTKRRHEGCQQARRR